MIFKSKSMASKKKDTKGNVIIAIIVIVFAIILFVVPAIQPATGRFGGLQAGFAFVGFLMVVPIFIIGFIMLYFIVNGLNKSIKKDLKSNKDDEIKDSNPPQT